MKQDEYASRANSPHLCSSTFLSALCHFCCSNALLHKTSSYCILRYAVILHMARPSLIGQMGC